ncbi:hypothetical protein Aperf_G00000028389 [Anoplocephala perfoliata]
MIRQRLKSTPSAETAKGDRKITQLPSPTLRTPLKFDQGETKLLYTLQWLLLDAASECADNDPNFKMNPQGERGYLHDLASLQLFIYLFAPILEHLMCEDFETLKLESGLRLWAPLMLYRQPYEGSFPVPVKAPSGQYDEELNVSPLRSYVDQFGPLPAIFQRPEEGPPEEGEIGRGGKTVPPHSAAPFYPTSPNLKIPNAESSDEDSAWYDRHSIPVGSSTTKQGENRPVVPMARLNDICPVSLKDTDSEESESNCSDTNGRSHFEQSLEEQVEALTQAVLSELIATDTVLASHCDLAVMRCLFSPKWSEAGAVWALCYLERRLALLRHERQRERAEANAQSRFQRLRATLPEAFFAAADAVTGQAADFGVLRSLSMPQLAPTQRHSSSSVNSVTTATITSHGKARAGSRGTRTNLVESEEHEHSNAASQRRIFTIGGEKQSASLSRKSSSSDPQSNTTTLTEGQGASASLTPAGQSLEGTSIPSELHRTFSHNADTFTDTALNAPSTMPSGTIYKRKQQNNKTSLDSGSSRGAKKAGMFEIKDRFSRHGKGRPDLGHTTFTGSSNLLDETFSKPLSDESISGDPSGFLTVPPTNTKQTDAVSGGILRRSNRGAPLSPKSVTDLIDLRDDRIMVTNAKSQTSLNDAPFFGSDITMNLEDPTDSQNSIDVPPSNSDPSGAHLIHRCHSDTNISYNSVQQIDEVTGSNQYVKKNGQINCDILLRGLYWTCNLQNSLRVCEHLLKNVYCLLDLCTLTWNKPKPKKQLKTRHYYRHSREDSIRSSATRINARTGRSSHGRHGPHNRSKSVAIPGLNSGGKTTQARSRGSSITTHEDSGSIEKLAKSTSSGRLIPFGRIRNRRLDDGGERSGDASSEEENSTIRSVREHRGRSSNSRKSDRYLNVDCNTSTQVRFQSRKNIPRRLSMNYSFRRGVEIPACGPMRLLPNRLRIVCKRPQRKARLFENATTQEKTPAILAEERQQATINFSLIMEILVKIIRVLGCSYGHSNASGNVNWGSGSGSRSTSHGLGGRLGDSADALSAMLRRHTHECFLRMFHINKSLFYCFFPRFIASVPITELMEFLHGLTSFCLDPVVLNPTRPGFSEKWSYHNSFGQSFTGEGTRGAEGVIISNLMGSLVRRLVRCRRELATQENISLFTEVRHLLTYLKSVHGNTFRRALLCALLCPMRTVVVKNKPNNVPLLRPRTLSARNSLWPTPISKRPSVVVPTGDFADLMDYSASKRMQYGHCISGQSWKSRTGIGDFLHADSKLSKPVTEQRLIDLPALKENLRDFAFLLDCLEPGTLPEPQLVASFLDLNAPVLARACLLLECAYFVNRCNRGEWPAWMKMNLPLPIQQAEHLAQASSQHISISVSGPAGAGTEPIDCSASTVRTTAQIQHAAGRLFHSWAEALGIRIMSFLEGNSSSEIYLSRDFQSDENFIDDATVNPSGDSCPYALLMMAVQLLNEITTFLRESHQHATRAQVVASSNASSGAGRSTDHSGQWEGGGNGRRNQAGTAASSAIGALKSTRRRLSILMPMFAQGDAKEKHNSVYIELSSVKGEDGDNISKTADVYENIHPPAGTGTHSNRQISFAFNANDRDRTNSLQGSASSLEFQGEVAEKPPRKSMSKSLTRKRQRSGSFRQSFQLSSLMGNPRSSKTESDLRRMSSRASTSGGESGGGASGRDSNLDEGTGSGSAHVGRHASSLRPDAGGGVNDLRRRSESSEVLGFGEGDIEVDFNKRSPRRDRRRTSLGTVREAPRSSGGRPQSQTMVADFYSSNMPWIPAVITFAKRTTFDCKHQPVCDVNCFDRQQQQLRSLLQAIRQVYSATTESSFIRSVDELPEGRRVRAAIGGNNDGRSRNGGGGGGVSCQCSSDSFGGGGTGGNDEEESCYSDEVNDSDQGTTGISGLEDPLRLALSNIPLLRGAGLDTMGTYGAEGGDSELETSASILHRVFGGRDHQEKRNPLFARNTRRKGISIIGITKPKDVTMRRMWMNAYKAIHDVQRNNLPRKESSVFTSGWREVATPIFERFRRKGTPKRGSGAGTLSSAGLSDDGSGFCGPGGLSSLMNLSLLAGAGTGLTAANSSPSLARLLEVVKSGLANGAMLSVEGEDAQSEEAEQGKTKIRPLPHQTDSPQLIYLDTQVQSLRSSFFNLLNKGALLLSPEQLEEVVPVAWELLLEADPELSSSAASLILFAAVKCSAFIQKLLYTELHHVDLNSRLNAVLRFRALWTARQQVWSRLEEGASQFLKVPPPLIEYVLPSPTLGNPSIQVPDPAWETRKGTSAEEVQLKQNEATKTFVTASTSRRKQQQELLARAVTAAKLARDEARRLFHITTSSILELAATEAIFSKDHRGDENGGSEDGNVGMTSSVVQEEFNLAARKVSFAPMNRSLNLQSRSFSWRNGSIPMFRDNVTLMDGLDDEGGNTNISVLLTQQLQMAQTFFPSCICAATLPLTNLMDDCAVNSEGIAYPEVGFARLTYRFASSSTYS